MLSSRFVLTRALGAIGLAAFSMVSSASAVLAEGGSTTTTTTTMPVLVVPTTAALVMPSLPSDMAAQMSAMNASYQSATEAMLKLYAGQNASAVQALGVGSVNVDSSVALAGKAWADELAKFRSEHALGVVSLDAEWEKASQSLGELTSKATASMAAVAPLAFTSLRSGSASMNDKQLWAAALKAAGMSATTTGASSSDPCIAAMMAAASGADAKSAQVAGKGCKGVTACVASGLYFHNQLQNVASGGAGDPGVLPPADFNQLQPWQREAIAKAAPSVTGTSPVASGGSCGTSAAVSQTAGSVIPKAWGALNTTGGALPKGWSGIGGK